MRCYSVSAQDRLGSAAFQPRVETRAASTAIAGSPI